MKRKWGKGMEFLKKILTGVLTGAMMCGLMQTVPAGFSTAAVAEAAEFWSSGFGGMMADVSCSDMDFSSYVWKSTVDRCRIYKNETTWNETNINISCVQAKDGSFLTLGRLESSFGEDIYDARFESDDYKMSNEINRIHASSKYGVIVTKIDKTGQKRIWRTMVGRTDMALPDSCEFLFERSDGSIVIYLGQRLIVLEKETGNLLEENDIINDNNIARNSFLKKDGDGLYAYNWKDSKIVLMNEYGEVYAEINVDKIGNHNISIIEGQRTDVDGNHVVVGRCDDHNVFIAKYDRNGRLLRYAYNTYSFKISENWLGFNEVIQTKDGGYLATAGRLYDDSRWGKRVLVVAKFTNDLKCTFTKIYQGDDDGEFWNLGSIKCLSSIGGDKYLICTPWSIVIDGDGKFYNEMYRKKGMYGVYGVFDDNLGNFVCVFGDSILAIPKKNLSFVPDDVSIEDMDIEGDFEYGEGDISELEDDELPEITPYPEPAAAQDSGAVVAKLFKDYTYKTSVQEDSIKLYANGGKVTKDGETKDYKSCTLYTKILPSYIYTLDTKNKLKMSSGKVIVGITSSKTTKPVPDKGKIVDEEAAKIAKASIKNGQITVTAQQKPGTVYLWVMDTGDLSKSSDEEEAKGTYACCPVTVKAAPTELQLYDAAKENVTPDTTPKYTKATIDLNNTTDVYVCPVYKDGTAVKKTDDGTYSAEVESKSKDYFDVVKTGAEKFTVIAKALKDEKKTTGKIIIKNDQNGKKVNFTVTAVNRVKKAGLSGAKGVTLGSVGNVSINVSNTAKAGGTVTAAVALPDNAVKMTDVPKIYAMKTADGYDSTEFKKGTVKITAKPEGEQKKITASIASDKKTVTISAAKGMKTGQKTYFLLVYNTQDTSQKKGYFIFSVETK